MANESIKKAFQRLWSHTLNEIGTKANQSTVSEAIDTLTSTVNSKADSVHIHTIDNVTNLQATLDSKADEGHTHDVDSELSSTSTNPVQNKVVKSALDVVENKVDNHIANADVHFTEAERLKLDGLNNYSHPNSGVSAGVYKSVTVNEQGHIISGSNPVTLEEYGIVDAEAKGSVNTHNVSSSSHSDIRDLISDLSTKVNNFLDVDDKTTDQLSELIVLIQENASDIESITNGKVNVTDIIDNLTTGVSDKPLSAAQGVVLKGLIDTLENELDGAESKINTLTETISSHISSNANPHGVDKVQLGLGNVDNTADADKSVNYATTAGTLSGLTATVEELNFVDGVTSPIQSQLSGKADVGHTHVISNVDGLQSALNSKSDTSHTHTASEVGAATPEYVNEQIQASMRNGSPKLVSHFLPITATSNKQTVFTIDLETFDSNTDTVMVQDGRTMLFPNVDFTVSGNTVVMTEGWNTGDTGGVYVFRIEMVYALSSIAVATPPTKTTYIEGETFDTTGMVVKAIYADGSNKNITNYIYSPVGALTTDSNIITISYTEDGETRTCTQVVNVKNELVRIEIVTPPTKTAYEKGEVFNSSGMIVKASYENGASKNVTNYTYSPIDSLTTVGNNTITISYTENGITKTCTQVIIVNPSIADILQDFDYINNGDGTYALTSWKGTANGVPSTEIILPNDNRIVW